LWTADTLPIQNTSTPTRPRPILSLTRSHSSSLGFSGAEASNAAFLVPLDNPSASPYTMRSDINPFVSFDDDMNTAPLLDDDDDEQSTFSSVSNDSARRWSPASDQMECNTPPPTEIIIRTKSTSSDDSGSSNQTSFPVSTWQKSWVEGGAVSCICGRESTASEINHVERPSIVVSTSRSSSFGTSVFGAEEQGAQYRLQAPRHHRSSSGKDRRLDERNRPQQDAATNEVIDSIEDMSISPKSSLHRVTTDTTSPTFCSTVHETPILRDADGLPTTRDPFVFRPLMRRACTTNHTSASTQRLPKPRLQPRHATSSHVGTVPSAASVASSSQQQQLLGDRPRRKPVHGSESVFSFGSIVGQSSLLTPTSITNASGTDSTAHQSLHAAPPPHIPATAQEFAQMVKANKRLNQTAAMDESSIFIPPLSQRRKSALHQDWEYLCQSVRRWTGTAERLNLQRNHDGCLT
jgi:hypothetical protein